MRLYHTAAAVGAFAVWWAAPLYLLARVDPYTAAFWRFAAASLVFALLAAAGGTEERTRWLRDGFTAGILLAFHMVLWFASLDALPALASTALVCTYPAMIAVYEALRGETSRAKLLVAPILAAATLAALGEPGDARGAALALASALAATGYFLVIRRARRRGVSSNPLMATASGTAAALVLIAAFATRHNPLAPPPSSIPYLAGLALVPTVLGHGLVSYAMRGLTATTATGLILTEPLGAGLLSYLILGDTPTPRQLTYSALALLAAAVAVYEPRINQRGASKGEGR